MAKGQSARSGWAVAAASSGLIGFWLVLGGLQPLGRDGLRPFLETEYANLVFGLAFPVVGAVLLTRTAGHRLGGLYCLAGLACSLALLTSVYAQRGLVDQPGSLPGAIMAGWVSSWIWMCGFSALLTFGVMGFPDGRLPGTRWWPLAAAAGVVLSVGVISIALRPGPLENHPQRDNPLGLPLPRAGFDTIGQGAWLPLLTVAIVGSFAALIVRYRRASSVERRQLRWFLLAVGLLIASFAVPESSGLGALANLLILVAVPLLPLSVGVAVLRQHVDDVGIAVRRSLVYGWLLAVELGLYAAVVMTLDAVLRGRAQPAVALVGAAAVAVLYQPVRQRLQRSTDRLLYGDRGDPYAVLASVGRRLEAAASVEQALQEGVTAIAEALRLPYVALELPGEASVVHLATHGLRSGSQLHSIPLVHGSANLGQLVVAARDPEATLTRGERSLLDGLARHLAAAVHAVLLDHALQRSLDRIVVTREDERKRIRRELHDGLGPALAGVALGVDAARNMLRDNAVDADALLADLKDETLVCLVEVRRIVDNLRPPVLDHMGLVPALTAYAARLSDRDDTLAVSVRASSAIPALPEAVEAAAYRIATEAMNNVARHAQASRCSLRVDVLDGLVLIVQDDGIGIPDARPPGVGLTSMTDRAAELGGICVVSHAAGGGTLVRAQLPLGVA